MNIKKFKVFTKKDGKEEWEKSIKEYNKLVRDKIPEIIKRSGKTCKTEVVSKEEHYLRLKEKLKEEVEEFLEAENVEELADIYEVIAARAFFTGKGEEELMEVREKKEVGLRKRLC